MSERDPRHERVHPFIVREKFSLKEGPCIIVFPDILSPESCEFAIEWLRLIEKKLDRWAKGAEVIRRAEDETTEKDSAQP